MHIGQWPNFPILRRLWFDVPDGNEAEELRSPRRPNQSNLREELTLKLANPLARCAMLPAGMEPAEAVRHKWSPKGEYIGMRESIEPTLRTTIKLATSLVRGENVPGGNTAGGELSRVDLAPEA